jgi:hypothetical protein
MANLDSFLVGRKLNRKDERYFMTNAEVFHELYNKYMQAQSEADDLWREIVRICPHETKIESENGGVCFLCRKSVRKENES